jgi:hypothetical protein
MKKTKEINNYEEIEMGFISSEGYIPVCLISANGDMEVSVKYSKEIMSQEGYEEMTMELLKAIVKKYDKIKKSKKVGFSNGETRR